MSDAKKPSKLEPYRHLLGKVPDKKLSSISGVPVQAIRIARKAAGLSEPGEEPTAEPAAPEAPQEPSPASSADASPGPGPDAPRETSEEPSPEVLEDAPPSAPSDVSPPAETDAPLPDPCPPALIVTRNRLVMRAPPYGRPREFGYGDVFGSGDVVIRDWLWVHHRDIVTPFSG